MRGGNVRGGKAVEGRGVAWVRVSRVWEDHRGPQAESKKVQVPRGGVTTAEWNPAGQVAGEAMDGAFPTERGQSFDSFAGDSQYGARPQRRGFRGTAENAKTKLCMR